jgi:hypothetical protein
MIARLAPKFAGDTPGFLRYRDLGFHTLHQGTPALKLANPESPLLSLQLRTFLLAPAVEQLSANYTSEAGQPIV